METGLLPCCSQKHNFTPARTNRKKPRTRISCKHGNGNKDSFSDRPTEIGAPREDVGCRNHAPKCQLITRLGEKLPRPGSHFPVDNGGGPIVIHFFYHPKMPRPKILRIEKFLVKLPPRRRKF